jgi:hypothetical protein
MTPDKQEREALVERARKLASTVANIRQGQSSTPRCEPPSEYDIEIAQEWTEYVLAALRTTEATEPVALRYQFEPGLPWHVCQFEDQLPSKVTFPDQVVERLVPLTTPPPSPVTDERAKVRVKPLNFSRVWGPDAAGDESHEAPTPFGSYRVEKCGGRWQWRYCFDEYYDEDETPCNSYEEGVAAAQAHWLDRVAPIFAALEPAEEGR